MFKIGQQVLAKVIIKEIRQTEGGLFLEVCPLQDKFFTVKVKPEDVIVEDDDVERYDHMKEHIDTEVNALKGE